MDVKRLCNNDGKGFYPTPKELAAHMLEKINFKYVFSVLEPSAGKGDLVMEILKHMSKIHEGYKSSDWRIDTVEVDPNLRGILSHRFTDEGIREYAPDVFKEYEQMDSQLYAVKHTPDWTNRYHELKEMIHAMDNVENVRVVHDDF